MAKRVSPADVVEEMYQSVLATPKHQRRLRSKTFWGNLGFRYRSKDRVEQVKDLLKQRGLIVNLDDAEFGSEGRDEWIVLTFIDSPRPPGVTHDEPLPENVPTPADDWFDLMAERHFESEREVEHYFIEPLLEQLGYSEDDFAIGYPVQMYEGVKRVNKEADFVLFNGKSREKSDALLIVEAKKTATILADGTFDQPSSRPPKRRRGRPPKHSLTEDAVGQARAYALWLTTPYYLITNGEETVVYLFRGALQPDLMLMHVNRRELRHHWPSLYQKLNKEAVIDYKKSLISVLERAGTT
jgi:hypothetical protein